jgi:hypothetical protein
MAAIVAIAGVTQTSARNLCRPVLTVKDVQFSPINLPMLERKWSAVVSVDGSQCAANASGFFDIVTVRLSENAPDVERREQAFWSPPSVQVDLAFAADEAVEEYWLENITPCICRD